MEVAIATTIVSTLLTGGLQELLTRIKNKKVHESVDSIQRSIEIVKKKVPQYEGKWKDMSVAWRDKIAQLRHLICDIEDCVDKFKIKKLTQDEFAKEIVNMEKLLEKQTDLIETYIKQKEDNASSGSLQGHHAIPDQDDDDIPDQAGLDPDVRAEARKDLLELVLNSKNQQATGIPKVTKVISIVGSGGIGKTCLAAQVFCSREVGKTVFPLRAFVDAKGIGLNGVLQKLLGRLKVPAPSSNQDPLPDEALKKRIRQYLISQNERCFIVVCNVQNEELGKALKSVFPTTTRVDSIIIMTTTVQNFAQSWSSDCGHVYKMRPLSVELSGRLFRGRCPSVDEKESKEVGKECDGVPLAVITRAMYWNCDGHGGCDSNFWSKFGDVDWQSRLLGMAQVLQHGYDSLPTIDQQTCLQYFSLFRREHTMRRGSLIRRWLAEGAEVGCGREWNNDIPAFKNWKILVNCNAICPIQVSINKDQVAKTCRPSGAMLGYISHKSRTAGFNRVCRDECPGQVVFRRLSLQTNKPEILRKEELVSCLRTLVVSPENSNEIQAADLSFDNCGLLWVLDLEACRGPGRVEELCNKLKFLRYLSLRSEFIEGYVPQAITKLKMLETLDVGKDEVVDVHVDIIMLPCLKHLVGKFKLRKSLGYWMNPGKFQAKLLQTLAGFVTLGGDGFPPLMKYMENLRKVKVFFDPESSKESLSSRLADAITEFLPESADHSYEGERRTLSIDIQKCKQPTSVLSSLENAKGKLYSLKLCGTSNLESLPSFIDNNKLKGIEKLCISFHILRWQKIIDDLNDNQKGLTELKYLKLVAKGGIPGVSNQTIAGLSTVREVLLIKMDQFNNLQRICLESAKFLPKIEVQVGALTRLVSLHLISSEIGKPTEVICKSTSSNIIPPVNNMNHVAHEIPPLNMLKEVALQSSSPVSDNIKIAWHEAARGHPKSPQVLFIE